MDADVSNMGGHHLYRALAADFKKLRLAGAIKLQQGGAELEALRPFSPTTAGIFAVGSEDGRAGCRAPRAVERTDLDSRMIEERLYRWRKMCGLKRGINFHGKLTGPVNILAKQTRLHCFLRKPLDTLALLNHNHLLGSTIWMSVN